MDHNTAHGDSHEGHSVHLPDPSAWPLIVGFAALFLGLTLIWWSRDRDNDVAGPMVGAAAVFTLASAAGWAYEDGRMRKKAEEGHASEARNARYTQVVTFSIVESAAADARGEGGIITALEGAADTLRDFAGFQDLRITASPSGAGPLQVLAETTWSNRDGLTTYEESRQTLLDIITQHDDEVLQGSVQAFDMEVVRDTKDVAFKFGLWPAVGLLGAMIIGGFFVGAGLTAFESDKVAAGEGGNGEPTAPPSDPLKPLVEARDNFFVQKTLQIAANATIEVTFHNLGNTPHNVTFYTAKNGDVIGGDAGGNIAQGGQTVNFTFESPGVGTYYYQCDLHPDQMTGELQVIEAPAGGTQEEGSDGAASGGAAD